MKAQTAIRPVQRFTFKGNPKQTRYGWLRLTPAYSVHLVSELLDQYADGDAVVLDPFCGTGTTALACAERGIACDTTDINSFLLWLSTTKTQPYEAAIVDTFLMASAEITKVIQKVEDGLAWTPPLH